MREKLQNASRGHVAHLNKWWEDRSSTVYAVVSSPEMHLSTSLYTEDYHMSRGDNVRVGNLFFHILCNALMDVYCSCILDCHEYENAVVYVGVAHAETLADFVMHIDGNCMYEDKGLLEASLQKKYVIIPYKPFFDY